MTTESDSYERCFDEDVRLPRTGCPECDGRVTTNTRETVCDDCGLIIEDRPIDHGPEWRSFEEDEVDRARTGDPSTPTQHDGGLATEITPFTDGNGRPLRGNARRRTYRLRREQTRTIRGQTSDRNRMYGNFEVGRICSGLELGCDIRKQACALFASAQQSDLLRGRSIEAMAAAAVYAVCRLNGRAVTETDVEAYAHESGVSISWAYRTLNVELGLPVPPRRPQEFVARLLQDLHTDGLHVDTNAVRRAAISLVDQAEREGVSNGRNPRGIAAAALYQILTTEWPETGVTQRKLAAVSDVTEVTIRARWREIQALD